MDDLISRQKAIDALSEYSESAAIYIIKSLPSARNTGKWITGNKLFGGIPYHCSECGEITLETCMGKPRFKYCPNCGAKMLRGGQDGCE